MSAPGVMSVHSRKFCDVIDIDVSLFCDSPISLVDVMLKVYAVVRFRPVTNVVVVTEP